MMHCMMHMLCAYSDVPGWVREILWVSYVCLRDAVFGGGTRELEMEGAIVYLLLCACR